MSSVELARLAQGVAAAVNAQAVVDNQAGLRLYDRDHLPPAPVEPYGVIDATFSDESWDPTLSRGVPSGRAAWIVTGVGDRRSAAQWVLDVVRRLVERLDPAAITLTGGTVVSCTYSTASPSPPVEVGDLVTSTETYYAHVEAI